MNKTQSYARDLFDFPVHEPQRWLEAVSRGSAALRNQAYKVAHLLLYGVPSPHEASAPGQETNLSVLAHRLTPERLDALLAVTRVRPEIGHHLLSEAMAHPDHAQMVPALLPEVSEDPEGWHRVVKALLQGPHVAQLEPWLRQRKWEQGSSTQVQHVMAALVSANRVDLLNEHRALWVDHPSMVDHFLNLALPATAALTDHPDLVQAVVAAQPSEKALVVAWARMGTAEKPDTPAWHRIAQLLPAEPLASVTFSRDLCWISPDGNPVDTPLVADRLGRYATPDFQAILLERFPGQLPVVQALVRQRQSLSTHANTALQSQSPRRHRRS